MIAPLVLLVVASCAPARAPSGEDPPASTFASPSGEWTLTVTRPDRTWNGTVELVMARNGAEVWRRAHALGLRAAGVDDAGRVAGFGYTGESMPESQPSPPPDFPRGRTLHVFVLRADGALVLDETHTRGLPLYPDGPCNPWAADVFLQPALGRFVVRIADEDVNRGAEQWWGYDLATGAELFRERPKPKLAAPQALRAILSAGAVPGTPLVLVHWNHVDSTHDFVLLGSVFQLVDPDWNVVWSFDAVAERARDRDHFQSGGQGATFAERGFELPTAKAGERARFVVKHEGGRWFVIETARVSPGDGTRPSR